MAAREIAETRAWRIVPGAVLYGGPYDGLRVQEALVEMPVEGFSDVDRPKVVLLLSDGSELRLDHWQRVQWLHPEGRVPSP